MVVCFGAISFENKIKRKEHNLQEGYEPESGSTVLLLLPYQQFMVSLEETERPVEIRGPGKDQLWCQEAFGKITWLRGEPWCSTPPWWAATFQKPPRCPASSLASFQTCLPGSIVTSGALTTSSLLKLGAPPAFCLTHWLLCCTCYAVLTPPPHTLQVLPLGLAPALTSCSHPWTTCHVRDAHFLSGPVLRLLPCLLTRMQSPLAFSAWQSPVHPSRLILSGIFSKKKNFF